MAGPTPSLIEVGVKGNKVMEDLPSGSTSRDLIAESEFAATLGDTSDKSKAHDSAKQRAGMRSSQWGLTSAAYSKHSVAGKEISDDDSVGPVNKSTRFDSETPICRQENDIISRSFQTSTDIVDGTRGLHSQYSEKKREQSSVNSQRGKFPTKVEGMESPIVDEFGRLVQKGASESESEGERRPFKRRRSYSSDSSRSRSRSKSRGKNRGIMRRRRRRSSSRSRSPSGRSRSRSRSASRRHRRRSVSRSPRRKARRSRSNSTSPRWQRSYSRTPPRDTRRGDREYYGRGRRGGRDGGPAPCFQFSRGKCSRGSSCKFVHLSREPQGRAAAASWNHDSYTERRDSYPERKAEHWKEQPVERRKRNFWSRENHSESFATEAVVTGQGESTGKIQTDSSKHLNEDGVSMNLDASMMRLNKVSIPETRDVEIREEIGVLQKQSTPLDADGIDVKSNAEVVVKLAEENMSKASGIVSNRKSFQQNDGSGADVDKNMKLSDVEGELKEWQKEADENKVQVLPSQTMQAQNTTTNQPFGSYQYPVMAQPGGNLPYPSPINPSYTLPAYNASSYAPFGEQASHSGNAGLSIGGPWDRQTLHSQPSFSQNHRPASSSGPPDYGQTLQGVPSVQSQASNLGDIQKTEQAGESKYYTPLSGPSLSSNQSPVPALQSSSSNLTPDLGSNLPSQQSKFPLLHQSFTPLLPQQSLIPRPAEDSHGHSNQPMHPSASVHLNQLLAPNFPSSTPTSAPNNAPWSAPSVSNHLALQFPSTSYSYPLTTIPPLSGLIKAPESTNGQNVTDQYDPLSDVLSACVAVALKSSHSNITPSASHIENAAIASRNLGFTVNLNNQGKANVGSDQDVNEVNDVDVGALDNLSPENWSPARAQAEQTQEQSLSKKGSRGLKMLRAAVADHVKEVLKPTWREGYMSKEAFKTIAKKAVEKVVGNLPSHHIPKSQEKVDQFMKSSRHKISKLVQGYVDKYLKL